MNDIASQLPIDIPAFHFFKWIHQFEGNDFDSLIFIFSCPDGSAGTKSAPVRARMLYSSSKGRVESLIGIPVNLKLEINSAKDINIQEIHEKISPQNDSSCDC